MSTNPLAVSGNHSKTMSSTEIALLTGKKKFNIHRDIREQLLIGLHGLKDDSLLNHEQIQGITIIRDERGYLKEIYLDREHTLTLITGYDVKSRHAINKRWLELEHQASQTFQLPDFTNPAIAARAWADEHEQKCIAQQQLAITQATLEAEKPKIEFAIAIRRIEGTCSVEEFAKAIGMGRNKCFKKLKELKILKADNLPYQQYIDSGYFDVVEGKPYTDTKDVQHPTFQSRITGKGQVYLEKKLRPNVQNGLIEIKDGD